MSKKGVDNHPYIPNSSPEVREAMLAELGLNSLEDLHVEIPEALRFKGRLDLPEPYGSEAELSREVRKLLKKNQPAGQAVSFLGGGCWQHYVPAVCDEIMNRAEFLSGYAGEPYNDHGRFQTLFEYESMVAELVDMDVVNVPTFDWGQAAATSVRMASRITGRDIALVAGTMGRERFKIMTNYCDPDVRLVEVAYDDKRGIMDLTDLEAKLSADVAAVYFENPSYLGFLETQGEKIAQLAHDVGALLVVGVDPSSLGVLSPPSAYGADIVCGDLQPLGQHAYYGGSQSGFIATRDEPKFVLEFPSRLFGLVPTRVEGEYGFGDVAYNRTSFGNLREKGKEYVGTQTSLIAIVAGVYLALMGPEGMREIGETIVQQTTYLREKLSAIPGVNPNRFDHPVFKEFVVDFSATGLTVAEINQALLEKGIFGGHDLSTDFLQLGQSALYCVTEIHRKADLDYLVSSLTKVIAELRGE